MQLIIKNALHLRRWLKSNTASSKQRFYGKFLDEGVFLLADVEILNDCEVDGWPWPISNQLDRLNVPTLENANAWWASLLASCECEYRVCDETKLPSTMCCMTRKGVWDALPNMFNMFGFSAKPNFKRVSAKKFLRIVGPQLDKEMGFEFLFLGISVRSVQKKRDRKLDAVMKALAKLKEDRKAKKKRE